MTHVNKRARYRLSKASLDCSLKGLIGLGAWGKRRGAMDEKAALASRAMDEEAALASPAMDDNKEPIPSAAPPGKEDGMVLRAEAVAPPSKDPSSDPEEDADA